MRRNLLQVESGVVVDRGRGSVDEITFVDVTLMVSDKCDGSWTPVVAPYISEPARTILIPFGRNGLPLDWPLVVYFCLDDYARQRNPNRAVRMLVEKSFPDAVSWCGAMVVLKASDKHVCHFRDMNGSDIEEVRSFFGQL